MKNISKNKTGNGNKAQNTTLKAGSELDRVYKGVKKHPGLTISGVGKALRWKYDPMTFPICIGCLKTMNLEKLKESDPMNTLAERQGANISPPKNETDQPDIGPPKNEADESVERINTWKDQISKEVGTLKASLLHHLEKAKTIYNVLASPEIGVNVLEDVKIASVLKSFGAHHTNGNGTNGGEATDDHRLAVVVKRL
jgi:hypothetical protein